jgi:methylamine--corrinoid protein Co-methyltransferase
MLSSHEVVKRASTGPVCDERHYDLKLFNRKLTEIVKEYDIKSDPENPIPSDESLANDLFNAALDFYSQVGTYCPDTGRIIKFSEEEIKEAVRTAPSNVGLGTGRDHTCFAARRPEDRTPPFCSVGGAIPTSSEDLFLSISQARGPSAAGDWYMHGHS